MIVIFLIFLIIFLIDYIPLRRYSSKKDICVFLVIYFAALTLTMLKHFKIPIPSAMKMVEDIVIAMGLNYN